MQRERDCYWMGNSLKALRAMPEDVKDAIGYAIDSAQAGEKASSAKPMKGLPGKIYEVVDDFDGDTYRAAYTVKFTQAVYVLHVFQKKAKKGIATPQKEIDLINRRMKEAEADYRETYGKGAK